MFKKFKQIKRVLKAGIGKHNAIMPLGAYIRLDAQQRREERKERIKEQRKEDSKRKKERNKSKQKEKTNQK